MRAHTHTGFDAFLFAGVSALVFLNLVRFAAAKAVTAQNPSIRSAGKVMGALVTFE